MPAIAAARRRKPAVGSPRPRIAPPTPAKADVKRFRELAANLGLTLFPWQEQAARYLTATNAAGHPLYREVAVVVARQNGKTTLLLPLVVSRLIEGRRVMHAAQHLKLPAEFHRQLVDIFERLYPNLVPKRRGISWRAGQEAIRLNTGGVYEIVAATGGAPRGVSNDLVIIDEAREMVDFHFLNGIKPTTIARPDGQIVYASNAGTDHSAVLNSIRARATDDPTLAYLEWSAAPEFASDDPKGWLQANPAIGHGDITLETLAAEHRAALLGGTMPGFETEHLCRWQVALDARLVLPDDWNAQEFVELPTPRSAVMAICMDPTGERASAVVAWQDPDGHVCLDVHDTRGAPIDSALLGPDLQRIANANRVWITGFDPYTDADLARHLRKARPVNGREYANASEKFVRLVAERRLRVNDPKGVIADDLAHTIRRSAANGVYMAVRSGDEHTNTAAVAAVRAAWLASAPVQTGVARIF